MAAASAAATQSGQSLPESGTKANIVGTVVNALTGKPLDQVHISLMNLSEGFPTVVYGAMSDSAGRFSIAGVQPASYLMMVTRPGFILVPGPKNSVAANGAVALKPGEQMRDLLLRMTPRPVISGHVLDEYGDPVMDAAVSAVPLKRETITAPFSEQTTTDDRGEYRIVVPPGRYYIKARLSASSSGPPEIRTDGTAESNYLETYYPAATSSSEGTSVEAKPGRELQVHGSGTLTRCSRTTSSTR